MRPPLPLLAALLATAPLLAAADGGDVLLAAADGGDDLLADALDVELEAGQVALPAALWATLQPPPADPLPPPPGPFVARRDVSVVPTATGVDVRVVWELDAEAPGWLDARLAGPGLRVHEVRWGRRSAATHTEDDGTWVTGRVEGPVTLELQGSMDVAPGADVALALLSAPRGTARVVGRAGLFEAADAALGPDGATWTGAESLALSFPGPPVPRHDDALVVADVGLGLTLDDADLHGRARVRWELRRGEADRFVLATRGLGDDLVVEGPGVRSAVREGDRLVVDLQAPTRTSATVELRWTTPLPPDREADIPVPSVRPEGVFRTRATLQLARDASVEAVPDLPGWSPRPASALPPWGRDLVTGTPSATFVTSRPRAGGRVRLLRFEAVEAPALVVDVADVLVALTDEGRALLRGRYEVLNDRAAHLGVTLPPGATVLSVRVDGRPTRPVVAGDVLRVPLLRSVETLEGLISFPVEIAVLVDPLEAAPWAPRARRSLALPRVDATIAVHRTTVYLPPGWTDAPGQTPEGRVDAFSRGEGVAYGLASGKGSLSSEDRNLVEEADGLFQSAVDAWKKNDFGEAQGYLDTLGGLGAENDNVVRLQSNLDALNVPAPSFDETMDWDGAALGDLGEGEVGGLGGGGAGDVFTGATLYGAAAPAPPPSSGNERVLRRIKDQARARAEVDRRVFEDAAREAEEAELAGELEKAKQKYEVALEAGTKLGRLEQRESVDMTTRTAEVYRKSRRAAKARATAETSVEVPDDRADADGDDGASTYFSRGPEPEPIVSLPASSEPPPPPVTASTRAVPIPEIGVPVLYQHLLLPAGDAPRVELRARRDPTPRSL